MAEDIRNINKYREEKRKGEKRTEEGQRARGRGDKRGSGKEKGQGGSWKGEV